MVTQDVSSGPWAWEGVPMTMSSIYSSSCLLCGRGAVSGGMRWCVCVAEQKAQGQQNTIPLSSVGLRASSLDQPVFYLTE